MPWAPPSEGDWDLDAQENIPSTGRAGEPIPGQRADDAQQYDESLRPIDPPGRLRARGLRRAANDVLSVIGVVERSDKTTEEDEEDDDDLLQLESDHVVPIVFLTRCSWVVMSQWLSNLTSRLLVGGYFQLLFLET